MKNIQTKYNDTTMVQLSFIDIKLSCTRFSTFAPHVGHYKAVENVARLVGIIEKYSNV